MNKLSSLSLSLLFQSWLPTNINVIIMRAILYNNKITINLGRLINDYNIFFLILLEHLKLNKRFKLPSTGKRLDTGRNYLTTLTGSPEGLATSL